MSLWAISRFARGNRVARQKVHWRGRLQSIEKQRFLCASATEIAPGRQKDGCHVGKMRGRGVDPPGSRRSLQDNVFQPHRQLADALAAGVEDRVADSGIGTDIGKLAETLDPGRIDLVVPL